MSLVLGGGFLPLLCISIILNADELSVFVVLLVANEVEVELDTLVWLVRGSKLAELKVDSGETLLMLTICVDVGRVGSHEAAGNWSATILLATISNMHII